MKVTVNEAKETARRMNARQVVVCAFDGNGGMVVVSYGVTRNECQGVRPLCDAIANKLLDGSLPGPTIGEADE